MSKASDLARFGAVQSGNIIERLSSPCDGSSVTVGSGTYTFQNVTDVVTDGYLFTQASQWYSDRVTFRWVIHIGGSADTASGRLASWTSAKTLKLQANDYSSSNDNKLHRISYLNDDSAPLTIPTLSITAIR